MLIKIIDDPALHLGDAVFFDEKLDDTADHIVQCVNLITHNLFVFHVFLFLNGYAVRSRRHGKKK